MKTIEGKLIELRSFNADWCVGEVEYQNESGASVVTPVAGIMPGALSGDRVVLGGDYVIHPKYGEQFKVESFFRDVPDTGIGVHCWLMENLPDIGHVRADALVNKFGPDLWDVLENGALQQLTVINGITEERARAIKKAYTLHKADRAAMVEYMDLGLKSSEARVLFEYVRVTGDVDATYFKNNPYCLFLEARCVGLRRAIQIGEALGRFPHPDWHVSWVIHRARTYTRMTGATQIHAEELRFWEDYPPGILADKAIERALKRGWIFEHGIGVYQLPNHYRSEERIILSVRALRERSGSSDGQDPLFAPLLGGS